MGIFLQKHNDSIGKARVIIHPICMGSNSTIDLFCFVYFKILTMIKKEHVIYAGHFQKISITIGKVLSLCI